MPERISLALKSNGGQKTAKWSHINAQSVSIGILDTPLGIPTAINNDLEESG